MFLQGSEVLTFKSSISDTVIVHQVNFAYSTHNDPKRACAFKKLVISLQIAESAELNVVWK